MNRKIFLDKNLDNTPIEKGLLNKPISKFRMIDRLGFYPISIWTVDHGKANYLKKLVGDFGQSRRGCVKKGKAGLSGSGYFKDHIQASVFNPYLAWMILSAYCPMNARIYDPFAGGGTRGIIAAMMGHKYYGVELRKEEVERVIEVRKGLGIEFHIREGNSEYYDFEEESFDFSYTCPPYYNKEIYSDLPGDLSNSKSYDEFLIRLRKVMEGVFKGLKNGGLSIWVVGNFRQDKMKGELIHFNADLSRVGTEIGFMFYDELVFWGASNMAYKRIGNFEKNRKSIRVHEYILIFKK